MRPRRLYPRSLGTLGKDREKTPCWGRGSLDSSGKHLVSSTITCKKELGRRCRGGQKRKKKRMLGGKRPLEGLNVRDNHILFLELTLQRRNVASGVSTCEGGGNGWMGGLKSVDAKGEKGEVVQLHTIAGIVWLAMAPGWVKGVSIKKSPKNPDPSKKTEQIDVKNARTHISRHSLNAKKNCSTQNTTYSKEKSKRGGVGENW